MDGESARYLQHMRHDSESCDAISLICVLVKEQYCHDLLLFRSTFCPSRTSSHCHSFLESTEKLCDQVALTSTTQAISSSSRCESNFQRYPVLTLPLRLEYGSRNQDSRYVSIDDLALCAAVGCPVCVSKGHARNQHMIDVRILVCP